MAFSRAELFLAFRQAKQALAEEQVPNRLRLAASEEELPKLISRIDGAQAQWFSELPIGLVWAAPKRAHQRKQKHAVTQIGVDRDSTLRRLDIRIHLEVSPEYAVMEILWIWTFGPALEALLTPAARAHRLHLTDGDRFIDRFRTNVFQPWRPRYQAFREEGLELAQHLTRKHGKCFVASLDITSYYDEIDPGFLLDGSFVKSVQRAARARGIAFDVAEWLAATRTLLASYSAYRADCRQVTGIDRRRGIPIGSILSRIISNLALSKLDEYVQAKPDVRYYARYVDDIMIVATPSVRIPHRQLSAIALFLPLDAKRHAGKHHTALDAKVLHRSGSQFVLQSQKLKTYAVRGARGGDFLAAIRRDLSSLDSEWRAFLRPDGLGTDPPLAGMVVGMDGRTPVRVLRDVDRLKLERHAVGITVSKTLTAVTLLDESDAPRWCYRQLNSLAHVATESEHWVDFFALVLRMLGTSIRAGDNQTSDTILDRLDKRLGDLERSTGRRIYWNGTRLPTDRARRRLVQYLETSIREAVAASVPIGRTSDNSWLVHRQRHPGRIRFSRVSTLRRARLLRDADLRNVDIEDDAIEISALAQSTGTTADWRRLRRAVRRSRHTKQLYLHAERFLAACRTIPGDCYNSVSALRALLLTRPPTQFDVAYRWARTRQPMQTLRGVTNALRGTRYFRDDVRRGSASTLDVSTLAPWDTLSQFWIVLGNLTVEKAWFNASLSGRVKKPTRRVESLARVLNEAIEKSRRGIPNVVLVLPELSIPRAWLRRLASRALAEGIAVIAGLEYDHLPGSVVVNEAVGLFPAGEFQAVGVTIWRKTRPAVGEEAEALKAKGLKYPATRLRRDVVKTNYGALSALICSELLDIRERAKLLGRVDLLAVPAWNTDTATFEHTIQTTAGDLHCFVALANNALSSDCRVYAPKSERHERDVCRLIASGQDETIRAVVDVSPLRGFQLYSLDPKNPPMKPEDRPFKPIPPGYEFKRP